MKIASGKPDLTFDAAIISLFIPLFILFNIIFILSSKTTFSPCETPGYEFSVLNDQFLPFQIQDKQVIYWTSDPTKSGCSGNYPPGYFYEPTQTGFIKLSSEKSISWQVKEISNDEKQITIKRNHGTGSITSLIKIRNNKVTSVSQWSGWSIGSVLGAVICSIISVLGLLVILWIYRWCKIDITDADQVQRYPYKSNYQLETESKA